MPSSQSPSDAASDGLSQPSSPSSASPSTPPAESTSVLYDTSQDTGITEPDHHNNNGQHEAAVTSLFPRPRALTREEARQVRLDSHEAPLREIAFLGGLRARSTSATIKLTRTRRAQKAEVLRLRLQLANYKVRTGQTDVPLERLRVVAAAAASGAASLFDRATIPTVRIAPHHHHHRHGGFDSDDEGGDIELPALPKLLPPAPLLAARTPVRRRPSAAQQDRQGAAAKGAIAAAEERRGGGAVKGSGSGADDGADVAHGDDDGENYAAASKLTSSVLRGGAVSGLLRLRNGGA